MFSLENILQPERYTKYIKGLSPLFIYSMQFEFRDSLQSGIGIENVLEYQMNVLRLELLYESFPLFIDKISEKTCFQFVTKFQG